MKTKILIVDPFRDYEFPFVNTDTLLLIQNKRPVKLMSSGFFGTVIINDMALRELCPQMVQFLIDCCTHTINNCAYAGDVDFQIFLAGKLEYQSKFSLLEEKLRELIKPENNQE